MKTYSLNDLTIHPEAEATPIMTSELFNAFKYDIETKGQLDPVLVYRGRIIDGRHRYMALKELGIDNIIAQDISNNTTLDDIKSIIKSKEQRRHQTSTQLAIYAWKQFARIKQSGQKITQEEAAKEYGTNVKQLKRVVSINKRRGDNILDILFNGGKIDIGEPGRPMLTDSLASIESWIKRIDEATSGTIDIGFSPREDLLEHEQSIVNTYINAINNESAAVRDAISKQLYVDLKIKAE